MPNFLQKAPIFGTEYDIDRSNPNFSTTSSTFQDALVVNIPNVSAGDYILFWNYRADNSKSNTDNETEARFNDLALITNTASGNSILGGGLGEQFSGFAEFSILDSANLKLSLAIRRTGGNGTSRINSMNIMAFRTR